MSEPSCPKCGSKMYQRNGKNGPFWGCSKYSSGCRGTVNIDADAGAQATLPGARPSSPAPQPETTWEPPPMVQCNYCPKKIVWGQGVNDKGQPARIPLDPGPPCYIVTYTKPGAPVQAVRSKVAMVNHWITCTGVEKAKADAAARRQGK